jgi:hypothetical protein
MGPAAAQIAGECFLDIGFARLAVGGEEGRRLHDHAVDAVAALHRLLLDECPLQRVQVFLRAQPFERHNLVVVAERGQWRHTGAHRPAVHMDRAGAALRQTAAEARPVQSEIVAQHIKQRHVRVVDAGRDALAVDVQGPGDRHDAPPGNTWSRTRILGALGSRRLGAPRRLRRIRWRAGAAKLTPSLPRNPMRMRNVSLSRWVPRSSFTT